MNKKLWKVWIALICTVSLGWSSSKIIFTELTDKRVSEFSGDYNKKFHELLSADADVEVISQDLVEHLRYRSADKKIAIDSTTVSFLKKYRYDSVLAVIPTLDKFEIEKKRGKGVPGIALGKGNGSLIVRYKFVDVTTGVTVYNGVAQSDTSISLGTTGLRPVRQSVNLSAHERDQIIIGLIDHNIHEAYRLYHIYKDDVERDKSSKDTTTPPQK